MEIVDYLLARKKAGGGSDVTIEQLSVTENGTYSEQGIAYSPVVVNVPAPENSYQLTDIPAGTVSTIEDGTDLPMSSLKVGIEPVQDLHGYDHPWAGGAGKNLFDKSTMINGLYSDENFTIIQDTSTVYRSYKYYLKAGTYTFSASKEVRILRSVIDGVYSSSQSDLPYTFSITSDGYVGFSFRNKDDTDWNINTNCQIELGNQATSFTPYSNICPISGWTAANVSVTGENVWDEEWEEGTYNINTGEPSSFYGYWRSKNMIPVKPLQTYYFKTSDDAIWRFMYDKNKQYINYLVGIKDNSWEIPENVYYINFVDVSRGVYNPLTNPISLNYPSTNTSYHTYNGTTYNIQFTDGDNPLTVYGGTLDATTGELVVDRGYLTNDYLVNTADYESAGRNCYVLIGVTLKTLGASIIDDKLIASALKTGTQNDLYTNYKIGVAHWWNTRIAFSTGDSSITSKSAFKEWLALNGSDVCYELETPTTYHLTPTQVRTLVGTNNIWADTGDILEGKYFKEL